jgi:hypothetical protein
MVTEVTMPAGPAGIRILFVLKLQSTFPSRVGQGFDPAMIHPAAAIERHLGDAQLFGLLGDRLAGLLGRGNVAAVLQIAAECG